MSTDWVVADSPSGEDAQVWKNPDTENENILGRSASPEEIRLNPEDMNLAPEDVQNDSASWTVQVTDNSSSEWTVQDAPT